MTTAESPATTSMSALQMALYRILKSLAKVAMRYGMSVTVVAELLRRAYVDAAEESLATQGRKIQSSRVCALTGLYRKEVVRIKELPPIEATAMDERYNRSTRVISGWTRDADYLTRAGRPAVLPFDGSPSFTELVKRYSGDMTPKAMLEELTRLHSVELTSRKSVRLKNTAYIPPENDTDILQILGTDTADLVATIHHNIDQPKHLRRFQRKVAYLHIPEKHLEPFREFSAAESQKLLVKLDAWLDKRDTEKIEDGTPGARIGLGIYQFADAKEDNEKT